MRLSTNKILCNIQRLCIKVPQREQHLELIKNISFQCFSNEILGVVGESGSGKSITFKSLMGLLPQTLNITADRFEVLGEDFSSKSGVITVEKGSSLARFRGSEISMIFQEPMSSLNPTKTCGVQVSEILELHTDLNKRHRKSEVLDLFAKVKLPDPEKTFQKYPHEISGGQMQRVMIAMAIACKPKLLIADEPTTALDVTVQQEIINLLKELQHEYGMSIIFISHDLALVQNIADRIMVMFKGQIEEIGSAKQVFNSPQANYTKALLASRPKTSERLERLPTVKDFLENNTGFREITSEARKLRLRKIYDQQPILEVQNVFKDYSLKKQLFKKQDYFRAVSDVSFQLYPKESLGLVGESGCGKSTLGNMILGLQSISEGSILFKGQDIARLDKKSMRSLRKELQIIFQDPYSSLNPRVTVGNCIMEAMKWHGIGENRKDREQKTKTLINRVGLAENSFYKYPHEFSGGQRQRIGIARTIALEPSLIVCDESVSALDISVQAQVLNLLNELKELYDFSYLFISHDLAVVKYFCDRIVVMNKGKIEEINEADALYENPKKEYTRKLIAAIPAV
ncbi:ABC transporter ATP-binding protein [Nonlabens spongiae]|uniref:ABC transporter ATP-binding protein n=1 Tax=Nonlabens spongiae TaxID=331648 RepID=A0A1W6MM06_9FLAO|nr:dipeptide ABC transporter ATP-binding protein [Nonlabens spongiae]ARN78641.1 ABC transporter ATP-binding protein [Nonlabens spongiae]